ncbi:MAG TPA: B-box zinc finger protein [Candidatus Dormibacteraeota bacterium]|nr:B-box zinc finger protein [Candidatus Dormibacteraeota bacterium]
MNCGLHSDVPATGFCRNCGRALCPACTREVRGALYCEPCLAGLVGTPGEGVPAAIASTTGPHPGAALALGFIPGLGAVYNGDYLKALIHVIIFGGIIAALTQDIPAGYDAFLGIALGCFYFYMPIEAYRTAKEHERQRLASTAGGTATGAAGPTAIAFTGEATASAAQRPTGAIILIFLGVFLLLANFGLLQWDWFAKGWPFALIVLGIWLLVDRLKART